MTIRPSSIFAAAMLAIITACTGAAQAAESAATSAQSAPTLEFVFEENVTLAKGIPVGMTGLGTRNIIPITGGTFEGPNVKGTIMPGGWDWQLGRADGCTQIKADYMIRTDDGAVINVVNQGVICPPKDGKPAAPVRTLPVFEPPLGKYEWLGQHAFIGTLVPSSGNAGPAVKILFYQVK
jgi:hypothetical protein